MLTVQGTQNTESNNTNPIKTELSRKENLTISNATFSTNKKRARFFVFNFYLELIEYCLKAHEKSYTTKAI